MTAPPATVRRFAWLRPLFVACLWVVTLALVALAVLRFAYHDGTNLLTAVNAFTRYVYLPAYAGLILAILLRRRWLAVANLAIVVCHLYWLGPDFLRDRRFDQLDRSVAVADDSEKAIRIFFANVRMANIEHDAMLQEIAEANPDIIVLVEFSWVWHEPFRRSRLIAQYPFGSGLDQALNGSVSIFSKLPITSDTLEPIVGSCIETVTIPVGSQTLRLVGLHSPRPVPIESENYGLFWHEALPLLAGTERPLVIVGDFNATQYSRVYQQLKASGLRSAHEDRGRGYAVTWPNGDNLVPPIRIDQAFLSPEIECLDIAEGRGQGSDHKPLILDVRLRGL
jgi:endonuclease/exonuclease/phosphatase (EEP) superfamily protein YafD